MRRPRASWLPPSLSTVAVFIVALFLYVTRIVKPTQKLAFGVIVGIGGLSLLYLFVWVLSIFDWSFLYSDQFHTIGVIVTVIAVVLAAVSLTLDFAFIETCIGADAPKFMEWYAAYGLMVTLIWLYISLLRLLALLARNRSKRPSCRAPALPDGCCVQGVTGVCLPTAQRYSGVPAGLAQSVEHFSCKEDVVGSIPTPGSDVCAPRSNSRARATARAREWGMDVTIRRIAPGDGELLADLRLRALADAPYAFGSTYEEESRRSGDEWAERARRRAEGNREATFFAYLGDVPVGMVGGIRARRRRCRCRSRLDVGGARGAASRRGPRR